ncbi:uncharacterized mitochondrial protein AtMg00810-like [Lathyrus oleraceus]|uniref:uncharacterized mitochondrial protein AtMg00810-like n=1 Tax=Pisum sativum TaxID=3888 RepID=UPI0021D2250D|nr:uncharacterized mitochondrial protein AtMg00810-like [Pisum sativum]
MSKQGMALHQRKYVKEILKRFLMDDSSPASSPVEPNLNLEKHGEEDKVDATLFKQIIGSMRYVCNTRPDIGFLVGLVSIYMSEPRVSHMKAARRIMRYLKDRQTMEFYFHKILKAKKLRLLVIHMLIGVKIRKIEEAHLVIFFKYLVHRSHGVRESNLW